MSDLESRKPAQIAREHDVHPSPLSRWRNELADNPETAFSGNGMICKEKAKITKLERMVGQLHARLQQARVAAAQNS